MKLSRAIKGFSRDLVEVLEKTLSPRHGLINALMEEPPSTDACGLRLVHAVVSPPTYYRANAHCSQKTTERGSGASFSRQNACWAAIGEALERYCASIYWSDKLVTDSATALGDEAINLGKLIRAGRPEIRLFNPATERAWVLGHEISSSRPRFVPAAMTYLGYNGKEDALCQNDSSGLACGTTLEDAEMSALCELLERDLFASNWLLVRRPPRLMITDALQHLDMSVHMALRGNEPRVRLFYLGLSHHVHVILSVVQGHEGFGVVGAAASPSILKAVEKAVCEGLFGWSSARKIAVKRGIANVEAVKAPSDHLAYYLDAGRFSVVEDMCASEQTVSLLDLYLHERRHTTAHDIATSLKKSGLTAVTIEVTTPDVTALGMHVVRVVVPGLQPLIFGPQCIYSPDQRRLNDWRRAWNTPSPAPLNPHIHPFP